MPQKHKARFKLKRTTTLRGHPCIQAMPSIPVLTNKDNVKAYLPLEFVFDTGSSVCLIPIIYAEWYKIVIKDVDAKYDCPPRTRGGILRGYWGEIITLFLSHHQELPCFFYELEVHEQATLLGPRGSRHTDHGLGFDPALDEFMQELREQEEPPNFPIPLVGMAAFIDEFNVRIQDDHICFTRAEAETLSFFARINPSRLFRLLIRATHRHG
jgi:hypothetical protein